MKGNKLLVFDMDETLIHCITKWKDTVPCDIQIPYAYSKSVKYKHINLRPFVVEVLHELSKEFTIVVFTASTQDYADPILDYINKDFKFISKRFYRHHWYRTEDEVSIKDLRIFEQWGYDLKDVIIIDNATHWFGFQVDNGIPIIPFIDDKNDRELVHLYYFLKRIARIDDFRPILMNTFNLSQLRIPKNLEKIEGVIEYQIEDVSDDFFFNNQKRKSLCARLTLAEPTEEDIAEENHEQVQINAVMRSIPVIKPLNSQTPSQLNRHHYKPLIEFDRNLSKNSQNKCKNWPVLKNSDSEFTSLLLSSGPPTSNHMEIKHRKMESYEDFELIELDFLDDFEII